MPDVGKMRLLPMGKAVVITARGDAGGPDFVSRFFAPEMGIAEDPVTGSSHSMLVPFWADRLGKDRFVARQLSARGGMLHCALTPEAVLISGRVVPYLKGEAFLQKAFSSPPHLFPRLLTLLNPCWRVFRIWLAGAVRQWRKGGFPRLLFLKGMSDCGLKPLSSGISGQWPEPACRA